MTSTLLRIVSRRFIFLRTGFRATIRRPPAAKTDNPISSHLRDDVAETPKT